MKSVWLKGLEPDAQKLLKGDFISSQVVRKRLVEIAEEKLDSSIKESRNKANYESISWPYLQADCRGYERALQEIISLLS
jgi:hypothetical protein